MYITLTRLVIQHGAGKSPLRQLDEKKYLTLERKNFEQLRIVPVENGEEGKTQS